MKATLIALFTAVVAAVVVLVRRRNESARDEAELWAEATDRIR